MQFLELFDATPRIVLRDLLYRRCLNGQRI